MQIMTECIESGIYTNFSFISEAHENACQFSRHYFSDINSLIFYEYKEVWNRQDTFMKGKYNTVSSQRSAFQTFMITHLSAIV